MKKLIYFSIAAAILASCSPEVKPNYVDPLDKKNQKENTGGNNNTDPGTPKGISITAPTFSDGTQITWVKGDEIAIADADKKVYTLRAIDSGHTALFAGDAPDDLKDFKAFYPKKNFNSATSATNLSISVPGEQIGEAGTVASNTVPMVFKGSDAISKGFTMNPVATLLKFRISGSDIKSVTLTVPAGDVNYLGGDVVLVNTGTLNTSIGNANVQYNSLTMTPPSGSTFVSGEYCFSLISKADPRRISGFTMKYVKSDGSSITREVSEVISITSGGVAVVGGDESTVAANSAKVHGTVTNKNTGAPIADVPVSDGIQIVKTSADGRYSFVSDLTVAQNVFVIMPSEYDFSADRYGSWGEHKMLETDKTDQQIDFQLTPRTDDGSKYRMLLLGDPQQMSSRPHSGNSWSYVTDAINKYRAGVSCPLYQISLGDMVTNEIEVNGMAEAYLQKQKNSGVLTFSVPGNHDHVQKADNYYYSVSGFSKWFGPYNYAFNLGRQHFIFLDSIAWSDTGTRDYEECLNDQAIGFLEKDLSMVDINTPVHIFTHCPLTKKAAGFPSPKLNHSRMMKALEGRSVNFWYGHIHNNSNYSYTSSELDSRAFGVKSVDSHVVARCGGCWSCSGEVNKDGSPRGFVELDIEGLGCHWQFHSIDANYPHTMNVIVPGRFPGESLVNYSGDAIYCNVYMWDNLWSKPEIWIDGSKTATMDKAVASGKDAIQDPLYQHFYAIWKAQGLMEIRDEPASASDCSHLFKYTPASSVRKIQIRVKDRWGETHIQEVEW